MGGGFVGVDVFFVISGYLITTLIVGEVDATGTFSFSNFYLRRVRRLAPALFFTFALTFVCAAVMFSPGDMERFAGALLSAVFSVSNIYFWMESGYFDASTDIKPLLHTWSLSVEEQFYLIWPATLVFLLLKAPRALVPVVLGLAGLASLAMNIDFYDGQSVLIQTIAPSKADWFAEGSAAIYFLTPFRVFEFAIGAGLVFLKDRKANGVALAEVMTAAGLLMILFAAVAYSKAIPFPTYYALLPCIGAALVIRFASASRLCEKFLSHPVMVRIGLTSYSLYLIHWPIIVFYRYYTKAELSQVERWSIVLVSLIAAELMYRWVEMPVRNYYQSPRKTARRRLVYATALSAAVVSAPAISAYTNQGWTWRYGEGDTVRAFGNLEDLQATRAAFLNEYLHEDRDRSGATRHIVVLGDSLGHDMVMALAQNLDSSHSITYQRYTAICHTIFAEGAEPGSRECADILSGLKTSGQIANADEIYIVFAMAPQFWDGDFVPLIEYLQRESRPGTRIVLFGRRPLLPNFHATAVSLLSDGSSMEQVEQRARELAGDPYSLDSQMRARTQEMGVEFISSFDIACSEQHCEFFADNGSLMLWDMHHWTKLGARLFGSHIVAKLSEDTLAVAQNPEPAGEQVASITSTDSMSLEAAIGIVQGYMAELQRIGIDSGKLYDASLLPDSKANITAALLRLKAEATPGDAASTDLETGIMLLAHFQPDVGESPRGLDQMAANSQPWRDIVDKEKRELHMTIMAYLQTSAGEG